MEATNIRKRRRNPYDMQEEPQGVGMGAIEMILWLLVMAVLSVVMIWLLWAHAR